MPSQFGGTTDCGLPGVDLESFEDDYLAAAPNFYRGFDREMWLLDVTNDLGIPRLCCRLGAGLTRKRKTLFTGLGRMWIHTLRPCVQCAS